MPAFENPNDLPQRPKVEPLKSRTMTLDELQRATLRLIKKLRRQLSRPAHAEGLSDGEFLDQVVEPLETTIHQDRVMLREHEDRDAQAVEDYIRTLHWSEDATDHEKTLVAGNIRAFAAWLSKSVG